MGPEPTSPERFEGTFRTAFRLAIAEGARTDFPEIARSRASLLTFRTAMGLEAHVAEEIRSRVFREEAERLGVEPLACAPFTPDRRTEERARRRDQSARDRLGIPHGRAVEGEHPRRSGKR